MYGDFSRLTYNRGRNYSAVWSQQGRVQLDSDINEQTSILLDGIRTLAVDLIGPAGGHIQRAGFGISLDKGGDLVLSPGHYYVGGIRCEVPSVDEYSRPITVTYRNTMTSGQDPIPTGSPYIVFMTVWESTINQLTDDDLFEPALGPAAPDTTLRTKVSYLVRFMRPPEVQQGEDARDVLADNFAQMNSPIQPRLYARSTTQSNDSDPDEAATMSGYSGLENQLYRVEVHRSSREENGPTFKWSRDNGSVVFGIETFDVTDENKATVVTLRNGALPGRPQLQLDDCVEVVDRSLRPLGTPRRLFTVTDVGRPDPTVALDGPIDAEIDNKRDYPGLLRRWDNAPTKDGEQVVLSDDDGDWWIPLEYGIEIKFTAPRDAVFRRGDYWLIPARAATNAIYGPTTRPQGATPYGPRRRYAPLAYVDGYDVTDLRTLFTHLAWPTSSEEVGK